MEKNKTGKYLKYAIGEIVLVVIGILIALQINNWNDQRLMRINEKSYLNEISINLIQDSLKLNEVLNFNTSKLKVIENMQGIFSTSYTNEERYEIFSANAGGYLNYGFFEPIKTAYSNMISAQSIDLIRDSNLKQMLSEYYEYDYKGGIQERLISINRRVVDKYWPKFITKESVMKDLNIDVDLISYKELAIHKETEFLAYLGGSKQLVKEQNNMLKEIKRQNLNLILRINNYVDK